MDLDWIFASDFWIPGAALAAVVLFGLVCQKKAFQAVLTGMFNVVCGYFMLRFGAKLVALATLPVASMLRQATGAELSFGSNEAAVAVCFSQYALLSLAILICTCALNILVARFTKYKVVFFTGHVLLFTSAMLAAIMEALTAWPIWLEIAVGGAAGLGINLLSMRMCQKYVSLLPNGSSVALAHTGNASAFLAGFLGTKFGKREDSAENWKISSKWSFFRDASIASASTMTLVFLALSLIAGKGALEAAGMAIKGGMLFGISISAMLLGIRFVTSDLTTTFKFFVDKLAPGSMLGMDCPLFFNFAPKSWLTSFLISYPLSMLFSYLLAGPARFSSVAVLCSVPCFFDAGTAGVIGNAVGGKRGVVIAAVTHALVAVVGLSLLSRLVPLHAGVTWGGPDAAVFGTAFAFLARLFGGL